MAKPRQIGAALNLAIEYARMHPTNTATAIASSPSVTEPKLWCPAPRECPDCRAALFPILLCEPPLRPIWVFPGCECRRAKREAAEAEALARYETQRQQLVLAASGIPERYRDAEIAHPKARGWVATQEKEGYLIFGPLGSGKTYLACGILLELMRRGNRVRFVSIPELLDAWRFEGAGSPLYRAAKEWSVVALDDLGAHVGRDDKAWVGDLLEAVIDARYRERRTTVVTTNAKTEDELRTLAGERVTSRLMEMCVTLALVGHDRRRGG